MVFPKPLQYPQAESWRSSLGEGRLESKKVQWLTQAYIECQKKSWDVSNTVSHYF